MAKPHCLVVSYPLQGTLIPTVHLALRLAEKGLTVTFVNTESVDRRISTAHPEQYSSPNDDIFAGARKMGLDVRYELVSDGLPLEFDRSLNHDQFMAALLHVFSAHVDHLLSRIMSTAPKEDPPITCLIADTFFVWPATLARKYGLLYVSFWTEPAAVFSLYYHLPLLRLHGHFGSIDKREEPIDYIPGVASMEPGDLMSYLQDTDISTVKHQIIFKAFDQAKLTDYVLCNTVHELEPEVVAALGAEKPFYAIGPISRLPARPVSLPATTMWSESDCSRWLAGKSRGTVLYISFGSFAHLSYSDLHEVAMGITTIACSNTNNLSFLWALRPDTVRGLKEEFYEEYCKDDQGRRHRVVQWCDQSSVLSNPAIGGFLTHCGWNSVLESLWCGVPMLCLPQLTDQLTNRKLVVDDWKVGVTVGKAGAVRREAVAKAVEEVMMGKHGEEMRTKVKNLGRVLHGAVSHGSGSSAKSLDRFVHDLKNSVNKDDKNSPF